MFSDESGIGSIKDEPITVVAAVVIRADTQWDSIQSDINNLLLKLPEDKRAGFAFHAYRLFGRLERGVNKELLSGILSIPFRRHLPILCGAADRRGLAKSLNTNDIDRVTIVAQALCFTLAAVRLETTASAFFDTQSLQKILWIANTAKAGALMKEGLRLFQQTPMFPDLPETIES